MTRFEVFSLAILLVLVLGGMIGRPLLHIANELNLIRRHLQSQDRIDP